MRLKLKIIYLFLWYFLKLKIVHNGVLWEWGFYFCLGFRCQFFGHTKLGDSWVFNFFFHFGFKGVMEKCVGCFLVYLFFFYFFFWGGRLLKRCEKWGVYVIALKSYIHVLFMFFNSWKGDKVKGPERCNTHY